MGLSDCASMPEGHLQSDCGSQDMPDVPDVLKDLDVVPLCQMAQDCTYGTKSVCNDGSVLFTLQVMAYWLWVLPYLCIVC